MARLHLLFLILFLAVISGCGGASNGNGGGSNPGNPPETVSISGTVTYKGAPLAGATVTNFLTNSNVVFKTATSDVNGNYSFGGMSTGGDVPGEYQIYVNKAGMRFIRQSEAARKPCAPTTRDNSRLRAPFRLPDCFLT
jgi:Carboxypeptidase regulatory-like domain